MTSHIELISSIEEKTIRLLTELENERKSVKKLQETIHELTQQVQEKDLLINNLRQNKQNNNPSSEKGNENVGLKDRIDEMLREIDKCMGMLHS